MNRFKNLEIWKKAVQLATQIYKITSDFPVEEKYDLISQLRRCVVSIGSNIAEGAGRNTNKDFRWFLSLSYELETQLIIAMNLGFIKKSECQKLSKELTELQKMIFTFSKKLNSK